MASNNIIAVLLAGCALAALAVPCDRAGSAPCDDEEGLNPAELAGVVVGSVAGAAAIAGGVALTGARKHPSKEVTGAGAPQAPPSTTQTPTKAAPAPAPKAPTFPDVAINPAAPVIPEVAEDAAVEVVEDKIVAAEDAPPGPAPSMSSIVAAEAATQAPPSAALIADAIDLKAIVAAQTATQVPPSTTLTTTQPTCVLYTACLPGTVCPAGMECYQGVDPVTGAQLGGEVVPLIPIAAPMQVPGGNRLWNSDDKPVAVQTDIAAKVGSSSVLMGVSAVVFFGCAFLVISGFIYARRNMNRPTRSITMQDFSLVEDLEEVIE